MRDVKDTPTNQTKGHQTMFRTINDWQREATEIASISEVTGEKVIPSDFWVEFILNSSPHSSHHYSSFSMKRGTLYKLETFIDYIEEFMVKPFI